MTYHSWGCYQHSMLKGTNPCICWEEIKAGDQVHYYATNDGRFISGMVTEVFTHKKDKMVKMTTIDEPVMASYCVLVFPDEAA